MAGPGPCGCLIGEAANTTRSPTWRSWWRQYEAVRSPLVGAAGQVQLKAIYKDNADTIIGNMDSQVFLMALSLRH